MSEAEGRLNQLEALLNMRRSLEAGIDTIDAQLRKDPPRSVQLKLLAAKNKLVAQLDEVNRKINEIVSRKAKINPPSTETIDTLAKLADETESEADKTDAAEGALTLANNAMKAADELDLT